MAGKRPTNVEGAQPGDADTARVERFRALYDATYPRIVAYCLRRTRDREDAFDAVSDTFATVWRRLQAVPEGDSQIPWVYGVARRVLANQYRARERRTRLEHRLRDNRSSDSWHQDFHRVHEALDNLRPADKEILTLAAWDDLDNAEIAVVLDLSVENVAVRLHRARRRLGRELGRLSIQPGAAKSRDSMKSERGSRTPNRVNGTNPGPREEPPT